MKCCSVFVYIIPFCLSVRCVCVLETADDEKTLNEML